MSNVEAFKAILAEHDKKDVDSAAKELAEAIESISKKYSVRIILSGEFFDNQISTSLKFIKLRKFQT